MTIRRVQCRKPMEDDCLYETTEPADIREFERACRTAQPRGEHCMCIGTLVFELERSGEAPIEISLRHGTSLRWDDPEGDRRLLDPDALMDWLSERGVGFVRDEHEQDQRKAVTVAAEEERWYRAMPRSLQPFFEQMRSNWDVGSRPEWNAALEREIADPVRRARVLLELFGSGAGPWSGFSSWEAIPEEMLLEIPLDVLLAAIGDDTAVRIQEGAARLFGGWHFRQRRASELRRLPADLRRRLLEHVDSTPGNADRLDRARRAFRERS